MEENSTDPGILIDFAEQMACPAEKCSQFSCLMVCLFCCANC
jgi:hypothetical protein